jgi:S-formylglutathione hydrolase FrmB
VQVDFEDMLNQLISDGEIQPMIVVAPNSHNKYGGSWYTNSTVTGYWEDFIVKDVVNYMDSNYRTMAGVESRGIAGHSMGGYGTIKLAMRNPDIFSAAYALSPAYLVESMVVLGTMNEYLMEAVVATSTSGLPWQAMTTVAAAAAFAPDPTALPFFGQFPVTEEGELIDSVWQKWRKHDPYSMIPAYKDSLMKLNAIEMDCGTSDDLLFEANVKFSETLDQHGIEHVFEVYDGDHVNKLAERAESKMFPFLSEVLVHE